MRGEEISARAGFVRYRATEKNVSARKKAVGDFRQPARAQDRAAPPRRLDAPEWSTGRYPLHYSIAS